MKPPCHFSSISLSSSVLICIQLLVTSTSLLQLTTDCKRLLFSCKNLRLGPTENTSRGLYPLLCDVSVYSEMCLLLRCLETDFLLFRTFASAGTCFTPRCLAMGVQITVRHSVKYDGKQTMKSELNFN
jgi:hypothetical protein